VNIIVGFDPGLSGGIAFISPVGLLAEPMPVTKEGLDLVALRHLLEPIQTEIRMAFIERIHAVQMGSKSSMLSFGCGYGMIQGLLAGLQIPFELVRPTVWCKTMHSGVDADMKPKDKSLVVARRIFPKESFLASERSKKPHDGMIDAALIAEFGRRKLGGI
jgi:crossover junction endodeoxyribonuclease RuvC